MTTREPVIVRPPALEHPAPWEEREEVLDAAVASVHLYLTGQYVPSSVLINPLLTVWDAAHSLHPSVAAPAERMLSALVHRSTVSSAEVRDVVDEVRAIALQVSVLVSARSRTI